VKKKGRRKETEDIRKHGVKTTKPMVERRENGDGEAGVLFEQQANADLPGG
jgi:hypothetical protein